MESSSTIPMTAPGAVYQQRRARLAGSLKRPLVLLAGHAPARNYPTNPHRFRAGSSYLYFGGPPVENAALLVEPGSDGDRGCVLLRPPPGRDDVLWVGPQPDDAALAAAAGLATGAVHDAERLEHLLAGRPAAAIVPPYPDALAWSARLGLHPPEPDELLAVINLRLIKDEHELAAMRHAAEVAMQGHRAAMAATRPGRREADVAAAFMQVLVAHGCDVSFSPIITIRGEVFHIHGHQNVLTDGALLLVDAGAEEPGGYASDITRTFPVSGRWTPIQRHLYDTVLRALRTAVAACQPGRRFRDIHDLAARVICEGLIEAELLRGDADELAARTAHALFFPHGLGHLIGLDAHDMEDFGDLAGYAPGRSRRPEFGNAYLRLDRDLAPGMTLTVEPGIYLVPAIWERDDLVRPLADVVNRGKVEALLRDQRPIGASAATVRPTGASAAAASFGGIRVEHTVCVVEDGGPEVLSAALPVDADEVLACVGAHAGAG